VTHHYRLPRLPSTNDLVTIDASPDTAGHGQIERSEPQAGLIDLFDCISKSCSIGWSDALLG
jgi:hypothetical protein